MAEGKSIIDGFYKNPYATKQQIMGSQHSLDETAWYPPPAIDFVPLPVMPPEFFQGVIKNMEKKMIDAVNTCLPPKNGWTAGPYTAGDATQEVSRKAEVIEVRVRLDMMVGAIRVGARSLSGKYEPTHMVFDAHSIRRPYDANDVADKVYIDMLEKKVRVDCRGFVCDSIARIANRADEEYVREFAFIDEDSLMAVQKQCREAEIRAKPVPVRRLKI